MKKLWDLWVNHGTKAIGFAQVTLASIVGVTGVIADNHLKYWLAISGVLTAWRGFFNSNQGA